MISSNKLFTIALLICLLMLFDLRKGCNEDNKTGGAACGGAQEHNTDDDDDDDDLYELDLGKLLSIGDKTKVYYSYRDRIPWFSIEKLDMERLGKNVVGSSRAKFDLDRRIPDKFQPVAKYYSDSSIYNRGHMAPGGDFKYSIEDHNASYVFSNVFPQNTDLNSDLWNVSEEVARNLVLNQRMEKLFVYTGIGFYKKPHEGDRARRVQNFLGDVDGSAIPDFVFKIFYGTKNNKTYVFAILVENKEIVRTYDSLVKQSVSVDVIEALTGYEFPQKLKDAKNKVLCAHFECYYGPRPKGTSSMKFYKPKRGKHPRINTYIFHGDGGAGGAGGADSVNNSTTLQ